MKRKCILGASSSHYYFECDGDNLRFGYRMPLVGRIVLEGFLLVVLLLVFSWSRTWLADFQYTSDAPFWVGMMRWVPLAMCTMAFGAVILLLHHTVSRTQLRFSAVRREVSGGLLMRYLARGQRLALTFTISPCNHDMAGATVVSAAFLRVAPHPHRRIRCLLPLNGQALRFSTRQEAVNQLVELRSMLEARPLRIPVRIIHSFTIRNID